MAAEHSFNNKDGDVRATAPSMVAAGSTATEQVEDHGEVRQRVGERDDVARSKLRVDDEAERLERGAGVAVGSFQGGEFRSDHRLLPPVVAGVGDGETSTHRNQRLGGSVSAKARP